MTGVSEEESETQALMIYLFTAQTKISEKSGKIPTRDNATDLSNENRQNYLVRLSAG